VFNEIGDVKPIEGPVMLNFVAYFKRPKSHYGTGKNSHKLKKTAPFYHTNKPDKDNVEKLIGDALNGYIWKDDCQVCDSERERTVYCNDFMPRIELEIIEL